MMFETEHKIMFTIGEKVSQNTESNLTFSFNNGMLMHVRFFFCVVN